MDESRELVNQSQKLPHRQSSEKLKPNMTRRQFLKALVEGAVTFAATTALKTGASDLLIDEGKKLEGIKEEAKEQLANTEILIIDIGPETFAGLERYGLPSLSEEELAKRLGIEGELTLENLLEKVPDHENEELQKAVMVQILKFIYGDHGRRVQEAMEKLDSFLDDKNLEVKKKMIKPHYQSLPPEAIKEIKIEKDDLGNPTVWLRLKPEIIEGLIKKNPGAIVNLSLEMRGGIRFEMYTEEYINPELIQELNSYTPTFSIVADEKGTFTQHVEYSKPDGTVISKKEYERLQNEANAKKIVSYETMWYNRIDGYSYSMSKHDDWLNRGVRELVEVAQAAERDGKIIFAAAGNPTLQDREYAQPSISGPRKELNKAGEWPDKGLIMVGYWGLFHKKEVPSGYGADIYVRTDDLENIGLSPATSFSTAVMTRIAQHLAEKLKSEEKMPTPELIKNELLSLCDMEKLPDREETFYVINMNKVQERIKRGEQ